MFQSWWRNLTKLVNPRNDSPRRRRRRSSTQAPAPARRMVLELLEDRLVPSGTPTYLQLEPSTSTSLNRGGILTEMVNVNNLVNSNDYNGSTDNKGLYSGNIVIVYNAAVLTAASTDVSFATGSPISAGETIGITPYRAAFTNFVEPNGSTVTLSELDISLTGKSNGGHYGYTGSSGGNLLQINFHVNTAAPFGAQSVLDLAVNDNALGLSGPGGRPTSRT